MKARPEYADEYANNRVAGLMQWSRKSKELAFWSI